MFSTSILVVIMIILGGIGNIWGVLVGAIVVQYVDKTLLSWAGQRLADIGNLTGLACCTRTRATCSCTAVPSRT